MNLSGLFPRLVGSDQTDDLVTYSELVADLLELPPPVEVNTQTSQTITATAAGTLIPNMGQGISLTLKRPALCEAYLEGFLNYSGTGTGRIYFGWDGAYNAAPSGLTDAIVLQTGFLGPASRSVYVVLPAGTTRLRAFAYKGAAGATMAVGYARYRFTAIRPA